MLKHQIQSSRNDIINDILKSLKSNDVPVTAVECIRNALDNNQIKSKILSKCDDILYSYGIIFSFVDLEYKIFDLLKAYKGFYEAEKIDFATKLETISDGDKLNPTDSFGWYVPLEKTIKSFLEITNMFDSILNYISELRLENNFISNVMQAKFWKKFVEPLNELILPFYVYHDDLEVGNALGPHAGTNKFGCTYASLGCLPPIIASQLDSIFFVFLDRSEVAKKVGNYEIFKHLINELNFLRNTGIVINYNSENILVKFQLVQIVGDNLGLNTMLGFVSSFNCNFSCRICEVTSEESSYMIVEDESQFRTKENYELDIEIDDFRQTGR
ncbi:hypothetical protein TKK_0013717 [Trichogramma kaykai]|uniref:Uncharacterized protein n=1 Tax=Trichogramma kaykai TaxID=54128 RepID=A0ABD2WGY4_9HYME